MKPPAVLEHTKKIKKENEEKDTTNKNGESKEDKNGVGGGGDAMATNAGRSGEDVYNAACMACHSAGIAGAPKVGDQLAWTDRIAKGMDVLYDSGINGVAGTGMIARGGCADCSDDEIRLAVDFMVDGSR